MVFTIISRSAGKVGIIERGVDLVHEGEGAWLRIHEGKQKRQRDKGLFAAGEKLHPEHLFAGGLGEHINAAIFLIDDEVAFPALEEVSVNRINAVVDLIEGFGE